MSTMKQACVVLSCVVPLFWIVHRLRVRLGVSIAHIKGPPSSSFALGHLYEYHSVQVGEQDFKWQDEYGGAYRIKALLGADCLVLADPKALQYVCASLDSQFLKPVIRKEISRMLLGRGIAWAQGSDHKRHRKIMAPAFGNIESRAMMPLFRETANKMCDKWRRLVDVSDKSSPVIEAANYISLATLDALGIVAFDYEFGALDNKENELAKNYRGLFVEAFTLPNPTRVFLQHVLVYLPESFFHIIEHLPIKGLQRLGAILDQNTRVAKELVEQNPNTISSMEHNNMLRLLVQANASEQSTSRLSDEELLAQMRTIMVAGHETTGNTITFLLYELALHPDVQDRLRSEIQEALTKARARGDDDLTMADMDNMKYALSVVKETLRYHPVVYGPFVETMQDEVIPLSQPIETATGEVISDIPVGKGQMIHLSLCGYNRLKSVWGEDAYVFRPKRWLESGSEGPGSFGIYSGLANFISGPHSCLGWRFAIIEIQTFMIQVVRNFKLAYPKDTPPVFRAVSGVMAPVLYNDLGKGKQLPLELTPVEGC